MDKQQTIRMECLKLAFTLRKPLGNGEFGGMPVLEVIQEANRLATFIITGSIVALTGQKALDDMIDEVTKEASSDEHHNSLP